MTGKSPGHGYLDVVYSDKIRPITSYPRQLTNYLFRRFKIQPGMKLLDVGCGRGEFLSGFIQCGLLGYGVDFAENAGQFCPEATIKTANLEIDPLPYPDDYFDVVYSKSVIEHFYYPERLMAEMYRVLKPGGLIITLCPDWEFNYQIYYEDYTHRTPFTKTSLHDIHAIAGFEDVSSERFRQLPVLWRNSMFLILAELTRLITHRRLSKYSKWVRFSREIMLLSSGKKVQNAK